MAMAQARSLTEEEMLCAILRGEVMLWPCTGLPLDTDHFLNACVSHGVAPLVYQHLYQSPSWLHWPVTLRAALTHHGRVQTALTVLYEQELVEVLAAFADHGVQPLLMKGLPLAYTHYPDPALRPHCDIDLLIDPRDRTTTHHLFTAQGYAPLPGVSGRLISHQCTYVKEGSHGLRHAYDVHWKISNAYPFSDLFAFDTLAGSAVAIAALGSHARALSTVHALMLACIHRIAHHPHHDRLIWLYDIDLLARSLSHAEWTTLGKLACNAQVQEICRRGLELAQSRFGTVLLQDGMALLQTDDASARPSPVGRYLAPQPRRLDRLCAELAALPGWQQKGRLLWEHAFPPAAYMLQRYGVAKWAWLPACYLYRGIRGLGHLLRRAS